MTHTWALHAPHLFLGSFYSWLQSFVNMIYSPDMIKKAYNSMSKVDGVWDKI